MCVWIEDGCHHSSSIVCPGKFMKGDYVTSGFDKKHLHVGIKPCMDYKSERHECCC